MSGIHFASSICKPTQSRVRTDLHSSHTSTKDGRRVNSGRTQGKNGMRRFARSALTTVGWSGISAAPLFDPCDAEKR